MLGILKSRSTVFQTRPDGRGGGLGNQTVRWVERSRRRLSNIRHPVAPKLTLFLIRKLDQINSVKHNLTRGNPASRLGISHRGKAQRGFSSARFTNQAQDLSCAQGQINALDDVMPFLVRKALNFQALN